MTVDAPLRMAVIGNSGRMGREIAALAATRSDVLLVGGVNRASMANLPVLAERAEVLVDFSRPEATAGVVAVAASVGRPLVIGTTGLSAEQVTGLRGLSETVPVWFARNMSTGVGAMQRLLPVLAQALAGFDIEVLEAHHRGKMDAPSGTALMLAEAIVAGLGEAQSHEYVYGREGTSPRVSGEIGMHSVRGGGNPGEHTVLFASDDEEIRVSHRAFGRQVFAAGAIRAALAICGAEPGWYGPE